jgi:polyisoprenoid-binding protein YceI
MAWQIDTSHSSVNFSVRHMMISTARGGFTTFSGTVEIDEANPSNSTVDVQIDAASIDTRDEKRDAHLRSADFFDVENYPVITFKSTRVEPVDESTGRIVGDLTIRGVTREVVLNTEFIGQAKSPWGTTSYGFEAETRINRKDFGLNWNVALETGGFLVSDEIKISIQLEVVKQVEEAQELAAAEAAAD